MISLRAWLVVLVVLLIPILLSACSYPQADVASHSLQSETNNGSLPSSPSQDRVEYGDIPKTAKPFKQITRPIEEKPRPPKVTYPRYPNFVMTTVKQVIYGDTVEVRFEDGQVETVKLIGLGTYKFDDDPVSYSLALDPLNFTKKILGDKQIWLEFDVEQRDTEGLLLAYVWLTEPKEANEAEAEEKMFNALLLRNGHAMKLLVVSPNMKYDRLFKKMEEEARTNQRGLWLEETVASDVPE